MTLKYLLFFMFGYLSGSILFGQIITKLLKQKNLSIISDDENPGVANAFKYGSFLCGISTLIFDLIKGFIPIYIALKFLDIKHLLFSFVMIAPVLGHAFSCYYLFKNGGKCITVSFGVLLGFFPHIFPAWILAFTFIFFSLIIIITPHAYRTIITYLTWICELIVSSFVFHIEFTILLGSCLITLIIIIKHLKTVREGENKEVHFVFGKN